MSSEEKLLQYLKKVTADLSETRRQLDEARTPEPVAIIGMSCRFPGGVRGPAKPSEDVLTQLDRLTAGLDSLPDTEIDRTALAARLRQLAAKLTGGTDGAVADRLENASAEDVFDYIDREFGVA